MGKPIISIVIPCLNEKQTISRVVFDADRHAFSVFKNRKLFEIIVADNGSIDGSQVLVRQTKLAQLIRVPIRGYGAALHWGILKAKSDYVLFADADLSYPFSNTNRFVKFIKSKPDLVLGSRIRGKIQKGAMPTLNRYLGTPALTTLIRYIYHIPTTDCNSGMRMVRKDFYRMLNMRNSGMEWASELLIKTALKRGKYLEVPIKFNKDRRGRKPHLSRWSDGWRHLKAIILLKPSIFIIFMMISILCAVLTYKISFALTSLFLLVFVVLFFSYLALHFLAYAIEGIPNKVSVLLNSNMLIPWVIMMITSLLGIILLLPETKLGTKHFIIGTISIMIMWTFLIETIKTHLINRLPGEYDKTKT